MIAEVIAPWRRDSDCPVHLRITVARQPQRNDERGSHKKKKPEGKKDGVQ